MIKTSMNNHILVACLSARTLAHRGFKLCLKFFTVNISSGPGARERQDLLKVRLSAWTERQQKAYLDSSCQVYRLGDLLERCGTATYPVELQPAL